eukprot:3996653-Pleurochrysis_carterae.AAC.1
MYLGEIAPAHMRGTLGASFLLTGVTGVDSPHAAPESLPPRVAALAPLYSERKPDGSTWRQWS